MRIYPRFKLSTSVSCGWRRSTKSIGGATISSTGSVTDKGADLSPELFGVGELTLAENDEDSRSFFFCKG